MKFHLFSKLIRDELKFIALPTLIIDIILLVATLPFFGLGLSSLFGLLLGNVAMFANMILLGFSAERAVERSASSAKRYMLMFYFIRFALMAAAMILAFRTEVINPFFTVISLIYPKLIYTISAILPKKGG